VSIDYCGDLGFLPKLNLYPKFNLGDTVKVEDAAWELGIRDTFSLTNKQCFVMGFVRSGSIYLNFVNPNIFQDKKLFPKRIPIKREFIYNSKILLIEQKIKN
jgi:hypothetical protein